MRRRRARWRGARRVEAAASRTSGGVAYVPASGGFAIAAAAPVSVVAATDETAAAPTPRYARAVSVSARAAEGVENNLRTVTLLPHTGHARRAILAEAARAP